MMNIIAKNSQRTFQQVCSGTNILKNYSFKSAIALEHLYPQSSLKLTTPKVCIYTSIEIYAHFLYFYVHNCSHLKIVNITYQWMS